MNKSTEDKRVGDEESFLNQNRIVDHEPKRSWRSWLIGKPLPTADAPHQKIGKAVGLAVFGADALSSIAYAPQETLVILAAAGTKAFGYAFPISLIITVLLAIVTLSYQQTIHAYTNGGGAYQLRINFGANNPRDIEEGFRRLGRAWHDVAQHYAEIEKSPLM